MTQAGIAIVEVLVSALVLLIFSVGVVTVLTGSTRATAQERHRGQANALAEQELERVRSLRIIDLVSLNSTRWVLDDGTQLATGCPTSGAQSRQTCYTITSTSQFQDEPAATNGCSAGSGSRDYMVLTVSVSWTGMGALHPVKAATIVSPPSGSFVPNSGSVLVNVTDSRNVGISGVALSGSGPGSFSGTTERDGLRAVAQRAGRDLHDVCRRHGCRHGGSERQRARQPAGERRRSGHQHGQPPVRPAGLDPGHHLPHPRLLEQPGRLIR